MYRIHEISFEWYWECEATSGQGEATEDGGCRERSNLCFGWIVGQWKLLLSMADILFQVPVFVYLYFCLFLYFFLKKLGRTKRDTLGGKKKTDRGKLWGKTQSTIPC